VDLDPQVVGAQDADDGLVGRYQVAGAHRDDLDDGLLLGDHVLLGIVDAQLRQPAGGLVIAGLGRFLVFLAGAGLEQFPVGLALLPLAARGFLVLGAIAGHVHLILGLVRQKAPAGPLARALGGIQVRLGGGRRVELVDALVILARLLVFALGGLHLALGLQ